MICFLMGLFASAGMPSRSSLLRSEQELQRHRGSSKGPSLAAALIKTQFVGGGNNLSNLNFQLPPFLLFKQEEVINCQSCALRAAPLVQPTHKVAALAGLQLLLQIVLSCEEVM